MTALGPDLVHRKPPPVVPQTIMDKPIASLTVREAGKRLYYENWHLIDEHHTATKLYPAHGGDWPGYEEAGRVIAIRSRAYEALRAAQLPKITTKGKQGKIERSQRMHSTVMHGVDYDDIKAINDKTQELYNAHVKDETIHGITYNALVNTMPDKGSKAYQILRWCFRTIRQLMLVAYSHASKSRDTSLYEQQFETETKKSEQRNEHVRTLRKLILDRRAKKHNAPAAPGAANHHHKPQEHGMHRGGPGGS